MTGKREPLPSTSMDQERQTKKNREGKQKRKQSRKEREEKGKKINNQIVRGERDRIRKVRQAGWRKESTH